MLECSANTCNYTNIFFYLLFCFHFISRKGKCSNGGIWNLQTQSCKTCSYTIANLNYSDWGCFSNSNCAANKSLICNMGSTCNCPINSIFGMCDCERVVNNEFYWNGSLCSQAIPFGGICLNALTDYVCQTLTQGTICNASNNGTLYTCQCPYLEYFDTSINKCKNQLLFNQSCNYTNMCKTTFGLSCIAGICE